MKLQIYFRPSIVVLLLGLVVVSLGALVLVSGPGLRLIVLPFAIFYGALFALAAWALWRTGKLERWRRWDAPLRLLILAPHEDDCVISAGGLGLRNGRLGGATHIVYLAPDEMPGMAERRRVEAATAWAEAGLSAANLEHLDLLPPLRQRDPRKLRAAARAVRSIIDDFQPDAVIVPMFEGGHIHHDMVAALLGAIVTPADRFDVFEAPEYGPYVSLANTPHRIIALCGRWLFGLVAYNGPPDGVDGRPVERIRLDPAELAGKRRMLAAFVSQNAASLVATRSYPDRLVRWDATRQRRQPFDFHSSYLRFVLAARRALPAGLVDRLLPVQRGTVGREDALTDWHDEWSIEAR